jgi:acyl carrier protein
MSNINQFLKHFGDSFTPPLEYTLSPETIYKELGSWSSMQALVLIAMVDAEYGVLLEGDEIQQSRTLQELFTIILEKQS